MKSIEQKIDKVKRAAFTLMAAVNDLDTVASDNRISRMFVDEKHYVPPKARSTRARVDAVSGKGVTFPHSGPPRGGRAVKSSNVVDPKRSAAARSAWANRTPTEIAAWKEAMRRGHAKS